jgi:hypothetical protein
VGSIAPQIFPSTCYATDTFFVFVVLGFELRAYTLKPLQQPFFVKGFFKIGSLELFAQVGLEL